MPLSELALKEIRHELADLHRVRAGVDERIKALETILTPFDFGQVGLPFQGAPAPQPVPATQPPATHNRNEAHTKLRAAILGALKEMRSGRAPDVARWLEKQGFPTEGKTRFSTRVYNDLWRLSERGTIKGENGVFSLIA